MTLNQRTNNLIIPNVVTFQGVEEYYLKKKILLSNITFYGCLQQYKQNALYTVIYNLDFFYLYAKYKNLSTKNCITVK